MHAFSIDTLSLHSILFPSTMWNKEVYFGPFWFLLRALMRWAFLLMFSLWWRFLRTWAGSS